MIGFENYSPISWLADKVLAVHVGVAAPKKAEKTIFRKGKWTTKTVDTIATALAVSAAAVFLSLPTSVAGAHSRHEATQVAVADDFADAPPLYYAKLEALLAGSSRLPAQNLAFDPPALV